MSELVTTMWVELGAPHHHAGRTDHQWADSTGSYTFEPFYRLEIKQEAGTSWCLLYYFAKDNRPEGQIAHGHHESVEEALDQAEFEFGVRPDEWQTISL